MLIYEDNTDKYRCHNDIKFPNLVWDDENEHFVCFRPNTEFEKSQFPVEVTYVAYENIQYIELYSTCTNALNIARLYKEKGKISDEQMGIIDDMIKKVYTPPIYK